MIWISAPLGYAARLILHAVMVRGLMSVNRFKKYRVISACYSEFAGSGIIQTGVVFFSIWVN
jgi:hypothetical protein